MAESFVSRLQAGRKEIHAAKSAFFISGFAFSTWVMMIPAVKQRLAIEADVLSLLLLCIGVSACIAMPAAGLLTRYVTCRRLITGASLLAAAAVAAIPHLPSYGAHVPVLYEHRPSNGLQPICLRTGRTCRCCSSWAARWARSTWQST